MSPGFKTCPLGKVIVLPVGNLYPAGNACGLVRVWVTGFISGMVGASKVGSVGMVGIAGIENPTPSDLKTGTPLTLGIS